jgi:hypothetical protein
MPLSSNVAGDVMLLWPSAGPAPHHGISPSAVEPPPSMTALPSCGFAFLLLLLFLEGVAY